MYLQSAWFSPRITGTEPWNCAVAGERLVSVLALFVSNCKRHCTVQIQSVIAAHDKYSAAVWFLVRSVIQNNILRLWCMSNGNKLYFEEQNYTTLLSWKLTLMESKWHTHFSTYLHKHTFLFLSFLPLKYNFLELEKLLYRA
jgi:hypothetical protein